MASEIDSLEDELQEIHERSGWSGVAAYIKDRGEGSTTNKTILIIVAKLLEPSNMFVKAVGLLFATGLNRATDFSTQRAASRLYGLTPAAVNASANEWRELLGIPRNNHFKPEEAVEKYRENGLNNHWRTQCLPKNHQPKKQRELLKN